MTTIQQTNTNDALSFGLTSIIKAAVSGNNIDGEVANLLDEARNEIGYQEAMIEWVNTNLVNMPILCSGSTEIKYNNERKQEVTKVQENNLTLWVIALDVLAFNKHINYALLAAAFKSWSDELNAGISEELASRLAKVYVDSMRSQAMTNEKLETLSVVTQSKEHITVRALSVSPEFMTQLNTIIDTLRARASMKCRPLSHKPDNWVSTKIGIGKDANIQLISKYKGKKDVVSTKVLEAVNKLQSVKFVVAPCIIDAAKDMRKNEHLVKANKHLFSTKESSSEAFRLYEEVLKYRSQDGYYFPVTLDARGRMYYRGGILSPQGVDFCKAAFQFANKEELGTDGFTAICIHTANVFGNDKLSTNDRRNWVRDNWVSIIECETHHDIRTRFGGADVFQALVAAKEIQAINKWLNQGNNIQQFKSGLVCHQDGTCNGLQHMAAVTGDRATAVAVNCVASTYSDKPKDVYGLVAEAALKYSSNDEVLDLISRYGRDMAKNPVMVTSYGATEATIVKNTASYLARKQAKVGVAGVIAESYLSAINEVAGAVTQLTNSIKICVNDALTENPDKTKFTWVTADGFHAYTEYRDEEQFRVRAGKLAARLRGLGKAPMDKVKTAGAMAPNFIHSIDATHLRMIVRACDHDLVTVHDSIGSRPNNYFQTARVIREKFAVVHKYDALGNLCSEMGQDKPRFAGDYKAEEALNSAYIFS